jgi:hypothetical protein
MRQKFSKEHEVLKSFKFDRCYDFTTGGEAAAPVATAQIYEEMVSPAVRDVCDGYNSCVLAYGQTGAGKTHTVCGTADDPGIVPLACRELFIELAAHPGTKVKASYVEVRALACVRVRACVHVRACVRVHVCAYHHHHRRHHHTRTRTHTHARAHTHTHTRARARTHTHTLFHMPSLLK